MTAPDSARDPAWIRASARSLFDALRAVGRRRAPPADEAALEGADPGRIAALLAEPPSEEEAALCAQVAELAPLLGLTPVEADLLVLATALAWVPPLEGLITEVGGEHRGTVIAALADALGARPADVRRALTPESRLAVASGIELAVGRTCTLELEPMCSELSLLGRPGLTVADLMHPFAPRCPPARLQLSDFAHQIDELETAQRLLAGALATRTPGVHVLVHGRPGVGKTELARAWIHAIGAQGREVPIAFEGGEARGAITRLAAWSTAQWMLASTRREVLVFDEVEDALVSLGDASGDPPRGRRSKGAFVRELETSAIPTVWIGNDVDGLDPAFRRRFTMILELRSPPVSVRTALARDQLGSRGVSEHGVRALGRHGDVTPALIEQVRRGLELVAAGGGVGGDAAARALVEGHVASRLDKVAGDPFDPAWIEIDADPTALAGRLARSGEGRVLLHGPPGTGKSAFGRYVAEVSGRPLHLHAMADVLSCWVGETEKQVRALFRDAAREGAVLVLDEVDALLTDRRAATASWEVSRVAQLLVEIEGHPGILIATSNLVGAIDPAFHRRFDAVLPVRAPGAARRAALVATLAAELGIEVPTAAEVAGLSGLVPGHVAQLRRRWRLLDPPDTAAALIASLREVVRGPVTSATVGFGRGGDGPHATFRGAPAEAKAR